MQEKGSIDSPWDAKIIKTINKVEAVAQTLPSTPPNPHHPSPSPLVLLAGREKVDEGHRGGAALRDWETSRAHPELSNAAFCHLLALDPALLCATFPVTGLGPQPLVLVHFPPLWLVMELSASAGCSNLACTAPGGLWRQPWHPLDPVLPGLDPCLVAGWKDGL